MADAASARWMGAWAPGSGGADLPEGTGIWMEAGSRLVLQVHYNTAHNAEAGPDRTTVEVRLEDSVQKPAAIVPWANPQWLGRGGMRIPAGARDARHSFSYPFPASVDIHAVGLHMHTLGSAAALRIRRKGGGADCLLDIPEWDFHWQQIYRLRQAKPLNAGDNLELECRWNNTTGRDVFWGEGTADEMCLGLLYMTLR
jgi:hypothetical protein